MAETLFLIALGGLVVMLVVSTFRSRRRLRKRQESLHRGTDGAYYWVDFDGKTQRHHVHPADPGGPWFDGSTGNGDSSGGFGGGGDGGGDGGD